MLLYIQGAGDAALVKEAQDLGLDVVHIMEVAQSVEKAHALGMCCVGSGAAAPQRCMPSACTSRFAW